MNNLMTRRSAIKTASLSLLPLTLASKKRADAAPHSAPFSYCLNTSTIRGQNLGIVKEAEITATAGYSGIEVWISAIEEYKNKGGSLLDLKKRINDLGLEVESAIGFAQWIVDDDNIRIQAIEQLKREMDMLSQIGGKRIAAPPSGATKEPGLDLLKAAQRYRTILDLGDNFGIIPQLEVWGFSANLHRLGQSMFVAIESGHPKACLLPDVYHIYKGGSDFAGLNLISNSAIQVFHMNDYPAEPPRETINDSHRVYPGDGIAPLDHILTYLANHSKTVLSLELFSKELWGKDPLDVAKIGLEKMKMAAEKAIGNH